MQRITLKDNTALVKLSAALGLTPQQVTDKVLKEFEDHGYIAGDMTDCGKSFLKICEENKISSLHTAQELFKITVNDARTMKFITDLTIWGYEHQCPECGCEVETEPDGFDGDNWTDKKCVNYANCGYSESNEPDHN